MNASEWFLLQSGRGNTAFNMALDEALLENVIRLRQPVLRFYGWTDPAASFGYFQKYREVSRATLLRPLVRRPTAGGIVPHDADWTYSLVFPTDHPWYSVTAINSYRQVHEWIQAAFAKINVSTELASDRRDPAGQCFAGHELFDVLWHGKKIAGAAQRRTRAGLLIQGSIQPPPMSINRADWESAMCQSAGSIAWRELTPDADLLARAEALVREKYSRPSYQQKR